MVKIKESKPDRANEISGLMMMAISGGAVIPFLVHVDLHQWRDTVAGGLYHLPDPDLA